MYLIEDLFSDFDGTLFPGNIAFSQFEILDKQYVGVLKDVRSVVRNHEETPENRWEDLVENLVKWLVNTKFNMMILGRPPKR